MVMEDMLMLRFSRYLWCQGSGYEEMYNSLLPMRGSAASSRDLLKRRGEWMATVCSTFAGFR
jgi:hypothetical protein